MSGVIKILMIDFFDSFTFNIVSEIENRLKKKMINYKLETLNWNNSSVSKMIKNYSPHLIIWGPGPGLVKEYEKIFSVVNEALSSPRIFNLGICLGHQLVLYTKGHALKRIPKPVHGVAKEVIIPPWKFFNKTHIGRKTQVQFYNSWIIKSSNLIDSIQYWIHKGEVIGAYGENFLTYQFHPESIGTQHPVWFFDPILAILCHNSHKVCR